jgi:predicted RNA binding protein YcfA (HicA-like mRNA interferase family)
MLSAGFVWLRSRGSHRIYAKRGRRVPFHGNATLHPKIVKQVLDAIEEASIQATPPE